jgi:hypothetical protein
LVHCIWINIVLKISAFCDESTRSLIDRYSSFEGIYCLLLKVLAAGSSVTVVTIYCVRVLISLWLFLRELFLVGLKKLEQRSHKCEELRGEYVE